MHTSVAAALPSRHRRSNKQPPLEALHPPKTSSDEDEAFTAVPVEQTSARGVFLLSMALASFAAFTLFVLAEMTRHHPHGLLAGVLQGETQATAQWLLLLAVPVTSAAAWFPVSVSHGASGVLRIKTAALAPDSPTVRADSSLLSKIARRYKRNHMFAIYQSVGWVLYTLSLALSLVCVGNDHSDMLELPFCVAGERSNMAVAAFIAEVIIISSVLSLERRRDRNRQTRKDRFVVQLNNFNNMLLLVGATLLAIGSEYTNAFSGVSDAHYPMSTGVGSLALFITAVINTYGLGGVLCTKDGWNFYQPFSGGARFVLFQIVSWSCFSAGLALQGLYLISLVVVELELFAGVMGLAGSLFVMAQVAMMMSLLVFNKTASRPVKTRKAVAKHLPAKSPTVTGSDESTFSNPSVAPSSKSEGHGLHEKLRWFADECLGILVVTSLANIQYIPNVLFFFVYAVMTSLSTADVLYYGIITNIVEFFMVMTRAVAMHMYVVDSHNGLRKDVNPYHPKYVLLQTLMGCVPAVATYQHYVDDMEAFVPVFLLTVFGYIYQFTYHGNPQQSGTRERSSWVNERSFLIDTIERYFAGKIIRTTPLDAEKQYVMAFHPHGIMPITVIWLQFTEQWRRLFPGFHAHILTASVCHHMPLARDVLQFFGGREVTRQAFKSTLEEKGSVMLVPGGQAEMLHQQSGHKEVRVYTHHKGFIRLAIESGVPLVPVLSFNEGEMMDNVQAPGLQRWFVKNMAFPFPYYPYGRGFMSIPRKVHIPIVVGEPMEVPHILKPSREEVERVHGEYFEKLEELFLKSKEAAGCGDYKLVLI